MRTKLRPLAAMAASIMLLAAFAAPATAANALVTRLTGAQEVPVAGDADGRGHAVVVRMDFAGAEDWVCWHVKVKGIALPAAAAHIHGPAAAGASAAPVVDFASGLPTARGKSGTAVGKGCVKALDTLLNAIWAQPNLYYVNVHNAAFPGGAVRGQLG